MESNLAKLYQDLVRKAKELPSSLTERPGRKYLGCPWLVCPRDHWRESKDRILIVGKEPWNWGFHAGKHYHWPHPPLWSLREAIDYPNSVKALMVDAYRAHRYEIPDPYHPEDFEAACLQLLSFVNRDCKGDVIVTNLFRCVLYLDGKPGSPLEGTVPEQTAIRNWQSGCLRKEFQILKPTAVVFFTGRDYDEELYLEFNGVNFIAVGSPHSEREFAQVHSAHSALPERTFRTYHPRFLKKNRWHYVSELATLMTA
jgi:hypothetical protein